MATNQEVIDSFLNQSPAMSGRLTTDGVNLYSYSLIIAKWYGGQPFVFDYTATGGCVLLYDNIATRWLGKEISCSR